MKWLDVYFTALQLIAVVACLTVIAISISRAVLG
jgi:hypothetical protein